MLRKNMGRDERLSITLIVNGEKRSLAVEPRVVLLDALREHLAKYEIGTDLIYPVPLHLQKCYADLGRGPGSFPVAEKAAETCVSLPIFPELTEAQLDHVIGAVNSF